MHKKNKIIMELSTLNKLADGIKADPDATKASKALKQAEKKAAKSKKGKK